MGQQAHLCDPQVGWHFPVTPPDDEPPLDEPLDDPAAPLEDPLLVDPPEPPEEPADPPDEPPLEEADEPMPPPELLDDPPEPLGAPELLEPLCPPEDAEVGPDEAPLDDGPVPLLPLDPAFPPEPLPNPGGAEPLHPATVSTRHAPGVSAETNDAPTHPRAEVLLLPIILRTTSLHELNAPAYPARSRIRPRLFTMDLHRVFSCGSAAHTGDQRSTPGADTRKLAPQRNPTACDVAEWTLRASASLGSVGERKSD
jgi:hypothetical protein